MNAKNHLIRGAIVSALYHTGPVQGDLKSRLQTLFNEDDDVDERNPWWRRN